MLQLLLLFAQFNCSHINMLLFQVWLRLNENAPQVWSNHGTNLWPLDHNQNISCPWCCRPLSCMLNIATSFLFYCRPHFFIMANATYCNFAYYGLLSWRHVPCTMCYLPLLLLSTPEVEQTAAPTQKRTLLFPTFKKKKKVPLYCHFWILSFEILSFLLQPLSIA